MEFSFREMIHNILVLSRQKYLAYTMIHNLNHYYYSESCLQEQKQCLEVVKQIMLEKKLDLKC